MRKVTREMCAAFLQRIPATQGNTHTDGTTLYLHGNAIARHGNPVKGLNDERDTRLAITLAGWNTVTTRERLSGLPGVSVSTRKGQAYLNGKAWEGEWVTVSEWNV